jgi:hypothetical protein
LKRVRIADPAGIRQSTLTTGGIKNSYLNINPLDDFWQAVRKQEVRLGEKSRVR